jgi:hypothetical protein
MFGSSAKSAKRGERQPADDTTKEPAEVGAKPRVPRQRARARR